MRTRLFKKLLKELREHCRNAVPWDLVFKPTGRLSDKEIARLQDAMRESFELWRDTWITPWIDMLEEVATPKSISPGRADRARR